MIIRVAAIAHSKLRDEFGIVGIEVNTVKRKIKVKLARQWSRKELNKIPGYIKKMHDKAQWEVTYIDQLSGEHFIDEMKKYLNLRVITTKKNMNDPKELKRVKVMDKIELVQSMLFIGQNNQIEFPPKPTKDMQELEAQMGLFSEMTTEAGGIDYFSPGDQYDNLVKALMIACFAIRKKIDGSNREVKCATITPRTTTSIGDDFEHEFMNTFPDSDIY